MSSHFALVVLLVFWLVVQLVHDASNAEFRRVVVDRLGELFHELVDEPGVLHEDLLLKLHTWAQIYLSNDSLGLCTISTD